MQNTDTEEDAAVGLSLLAIAAGSKLLRTFGTSGNLKGLNVAEIQGGPILRPYE